ncbi:hypothetical protein O9993_10095 [Vibrio lentus]|nr:hypothetical protein [Vibrio lentus]
MNNFLSTRKSVSCAPTNTRISGDENPDYEGTYVFSNDFCVALMPDSLRRSRV